MLAYLAITAAVLLVVRSPHERLLEPDSAITSGEGLLFALALVGSRYVSLSSRHFGVLISVADVGLDGLGLSGYGSGALGWLEAITTGLLRLVVGLLYALRPDAMNCLERRATRLDSEER